MKAGPRHLRSCSRGYPPLTAFGVAAYVPEAEVSICTADGVPRFRGHLRAFVERRGPGGEMSLGPDRRIRRSFVGRRSRLF